MEMILMLPPVDANYGTFESIRTLARIASGSVLIAIAFYLQIIAEGNPDPDGEPVSWKFRLLPTVLGFFILHRAGHVHLYPYSRVSADILFNISLLWLMIEGFLLLLSYYELDSPRKRIPEFIRESVPWLARPGGDETDGTTDDERAGDGGETE